MLFDNLDSGDLISWELGDDNDTSGSDISGGIGFVILTEPGPLAEVDTLVDFQERDISVFTESSDEFSVVVVVEIFGEDAEGGSVFVGWSEVGFDGLTGLS